MTYIFLQNNSSVHLFSAAPYSLMFVLHKDALFHHRDKTRVQMPAKMFPHLKLLCLLFMGPTLGFDTKPKNSFLIKFGVFTMKE